MCSRRVKAKGIKHLPSLSDFWFCQKSENPSRYLALLIGNLYSDSTFNFVRPRHVNSRAGVRTSLKFTQSNILPRGKKYRSMPSWQRLIWLRGNTEKKIFTRKLICRDIWQIAFSMSFSLFCVDNLNFNFAMCNHFTQWGVLEYSLLKILDWLVRNACRYNFYSRLIRN